MMKRTILTMVALGIFATAALPKTSHALLVDLGPGSFSALATAITFSEPGYAVGTVNPVYNFTGLAGLGDVTVRFGGNFIGQTAGGVYPITLTDNTPTGPLALDPNAPATKIVTDNAVPTSPVLSGTPIFNGPISVLFSTPVAGVALSGGYFNAIGGTSIEAYDISGNVLGRITNKSLGVEYYGLADSTGLNSIAGISFFITGPEPAGFGIDNLTFGSVGTIIDPDVDNQPVPEPGTIALLGLGMAGLALYGKRRQNKA